MKADSLEKIARSIIRCRRCPRLNDWCATVAREKVKRHANESYWGKPVPSFGDPNASLLIVGLAPAAHGANRTGRMFTGDRSGDWLYRALFRAGFASQETSVRKHDGLELRDCYVSAVCHCAPPANKVLPSEIKNCSSFLVRELESLVRVRVIVTLGKISWDAVRTTIRRLDPVLPKRNVRFTHGAQLDVGDGRTLIASYHPSQQNTFTGVLTEPMLDEIFTRARRLMRDT